MHFDQRTQRALREVGLSQADIEAASEAVVAATEADAERIAAFFADRETLHSDMDIAHSAEEIVEHEIEFIDLYTHAADMRGYLRFADWGVPVEGGRVLSEETVELTLGPTIDGRVRFTTDPESL